ncbi:MAG: response regulator [Campylobacteraceae bacterium]|nr:response regulator [Campylobacteraceae bacterium]
MQHNYSRLKELARAGITLLYVEANPSISDKLTPLLRYYFKHVDTAHSCQEAMELFTTTHHDIVITDVMFKNEDGYRMVEQIKAINSGQKIIVISAILDRKRIVRLINSLIDGYFVKPLNVQDLLKQLEKIVEILYEKRMLLFYLNTCETSEIACSSLPESFSKIDAKSSETFLVFDNDTVDKAIHRMHYKDEAKISAQSFFEQGLIDWDTWNDLIIYSNELEEEALLHQILTMESLNETEKLISIFANALELSGEFRDIGYALRGLCSTLHTLAKDFDTLGKSTKMIKIITDSIIDDLVNWTKEVLIHKSAVDVHYIDASLLANIAQLGLSVKSLQNDSSDDNEEEMEFF